MVNTVPMYIKTKNDELMHVIDLSFKCAVCHTEMKRVHMYEDGVIFECPSCGLVIDHPWHMNLAGRLIVKECSIVVICSLYEL